MDKLFLTVLNMSLSGAFVIAVICLTRILLKKAPKIISYCLWAVAGFRLVFPFSIESIFSLIPFKAQPIPLDIEMQTVPRIDSGITIVDNIISGSLPAPLPAASINPLQIWTAIGAYIWLTGAAVMLIYGVVSYLILKQKMQNAVYIEANIHEAENIKSPFVLGIFMPKIYLPLGLSEQERRYILLHEQTHIKRRDHIVKFAGYFILCMHWFNPFAWIAFILMGVDMEMSCDECVLKEMGVQTKRDYSMTLVSLATEPSIISGSPLAFSEGCLKERVKNVLNYKKSSRIIVIMATTFAVALCMGFVTNRAESKSSISYNESDSIFSALDNTAIKSPSAIPIGYEYPNYSVNENGQTYGVAEGVAAIEELPDLIFAGSVDKINGYVYSKELTETLTKVSEESQNGFSSSLHLYKDDGRTVIGEISNCAMLLSESIRNAYVKPVYPINENGLTYGSLSNADFYGVEPDLIAAIGIDGTEGYVYKTDLAAGQPKNPEEAVEYMKLMKTRYEEMNMTGEKYEKIIPLYAIDGISIIGEFGIGGENALIQQ